MSAATKISNHKLVVIMLLLCMAIMGSFLLFRSANRDKTTAITYANDQVFVFPAPRDVNNFELSGTTQFTQSSLLNHWTLLFFGFTHCSTICPNTLGTLQKVYQQLKPEYPNLQVVLVSLDPKRDNSETLKKYVSLYHKDFIGVTGQYPALRKLQAQFGVAAQEEITAPNDYQINHTASVFLVNPQAKWVGHFKYELQPDAFVNAFKQIAT